MALHDDRLDQADHLLTGPLAGGSGPSHADLRRAISNAYYAVFHFLVAEATDLLCPPDLPLLSSQFRRAFAHSGMRKVCAYISKPASMPRLFSVLLTSPVDPALVDIGQVFDRLQFQRHLADYDTGSPVDVGTATSSIASARAAIAGWAAVRGSDNAKVFLTALAMHEHWQK